MFWEKYKILCEKNNIKPRDIPKELDLSPAAVTRWKNGTVPNRKTLDAIAEKLNVTVDYLLNDEEYVIILKEKHKYFKSGLWSLPQRWESFRSGSEIDNNLLFDISVFVNASLYFLNNASCIEYVPENAEYDKKRLFNVEVINDILDIMDACADTDFYRTVQIQLSRIVLSHLADKGFTQERLSACELLSADKLNFLYSGAENSDITLNYGLNFSDLSFLHDFTDLSYIYMFTGVEGNLSDIITEIYKNDM